VRECASACTLTSCLVRTRSRGPCNPPAVANEFPLPAAPLHYLSRSRSLYVLPLPLHCAPRSAFIPAPSPVQSLLRVNARSLVFPLCNSIRINLVARGSPTCTGYVFFLNSSLYQPAYRTLLLLFGTSLARPRPAINIGR
jgi:hypothetical protein